MVRDKCEAKGRELYMGFFGAYKGRGFF